MQTAAATLSTELSGLITRADGRDMRLGDIIDHFPHRGHVLMIVLFSFPMSLPISPPFLGGVFGAVLAFLSYYLVLGQKPWVPAFLHRRPVSYRILHGTVGKLTRVMRYLELILKPRMLVLTDDHRLWRMHGLLLFGMAIVLALPIPIPFPFTNSVAALPIFLASLGMLEKDGVFIILGYFATILCGVYYLVLGLLGKEAFDILFHLISTRGGVH